MKKINSLKFLFTIAAVLPFASCDKGFVEKNKNPYAATTIDPALLFAGAERNLTLGGFENEQTIAQQFVNPYNSGATTAFNFNENTPGFNNGRWNGIYGAPLKNLVQIMSQIKTDASRNNLYQMSRILRGYNAMILVDTYGDVPYSEAELAYLQNILTPKYDKGIDIYADVYNELKAAIAGLDPTGAPVPQDLFYGGTGVTATAQVAKWKKLAYSIMLRLGMRYSKQNPAKAQSIAAEAYSGGVMASNADNMYIPFNSTDANGLNNGPRTNNPQFYYLAEPFINQLKNFKDPRSKYIAAQYANPGNVSVTPVDTTAAGQFGLPVGYDDKTNLLGGRTLPSWRGAKGNGFAYSQLNFLTIANATAPGFFVTYAETQLLLAEAALRGWLPAGALTAAAYYDSGVRASMAEFTLFPNTTPIPTLDADSYLRQPGVALTGVLATDLRLINTQYWVASFLIGNESWANYRRSGYPVLSPNDYNNKLNGGFVRRMTYPTTEVNLNPAGYSAAVANLGGDGLTQRVFWDIP